MPRLSSSLKVFSATESCSVDKRRARVAMGGQLVWMAWVVWWWGVGQVVRDGQVTLGYLLRRASTSGGHCKVGGGCGELSGVGEEGVAVGVAGTGGGGGVTEKTGNGLGEGNKTRDALQSMVILCRERKSKPRIGCKTFACKRL